MVLFSKTEQAFLQGSLNDISNSYRYKLKSILKKKISLLQNDLSLISNSSFSDLTKYGKITSKNQNLTKSSKTDTSPNLGYPSNNHHISNTEEKTHLTSAILHDNPISNNENQNFNMVNNQQEKMTCSGGVVRSSISPFQGGDPGFKW